MVWTGNEWLDGEKTRLETPISPWNLDRDRKTERNEWLEPGMNGLNQWLGPDVRLKGMNALKWATGCADGEENPLGNPNQRMEP